MLFAKGIASAKSLDVKIFEAQIDTLAIQGPNSPKIMETNNSIIAFNKKQIERNKGYSNDESVLQAATDEMNERLIDQNNQKIEEINISATQNSEEIANLLQCSMENRSDLISNKDEISAARTSILENRKLILEST